MQRKISLVLIISILSFALFSCSKNTAEIPGSVFESEPQTAEEPETEDPGLLFVRGEETGAVRSDTAKPVPQQAFPYELPEGCVIPFDSTVGFSFGERLKDYSCTDVYRGDVTENVRLRESGGLLYYGITDSYGNFVEVSREITGRDRVVYLTFDDGPGPYTSRLLDTLKRYGAKATFFVIGVAGSLDILPRMIKEGHSVGAHSYSHEYRTCYSSVDAYFEDLQKIEDLISEQIGHQTLLVRFPGGSSNSTANRYCSGIMATLREELPARGYQYFDWNVSSADGGGTEDTEVVIDLVKKGIQSNKVSVVLQHDIKLFSVNAVEEILRWGTSNGYLFLPLNVASTPAHHGVH